MPQRNCDGCGVLYEAKRSTSRFHSATCRKRAQRAGRPPSKAISGLPSKRKRPSLVEAVHRELESAGRLESSAGQAALVLAERAEGPSMDSGSATAAVIREMRAVLAEVLEGANVKDDPLDELRRRRDAKLNAG